MAGNGAATRLNAFNNDRWRHTTGSTHGDQGVAAILALELIDCCAHQNRTGRANGVAEHNPPVDIDLFAVQIELTNKALSHDREGLVDFPDIDIVFIDLAFIKTSARHWYVSISVGQSPIFAVATIRAPASCRFFHVGLRSQQ